MKLIKALHKLKNQFLTKLPSNDVYLRSVIMLCVLAVASAAIWIGGPHIVWNNNLPFAQPEKRMYIILSLFLLWVLKLLILDLDTPNPFQYKDPYLQKKSRELLNRFRGAVRFLKKTIVSKNGKPIQLKKLPWYLLIGPEDAGKTSLLANSKVNFILQRRLQNQERAEKNVEPSTQCDWWITRDACIIDVPGKYVTGYDPAHPKSTVYPILWRFFLRLIKKQRGKNALSGIILALPFPELMKESDLKKYQTLLRDLFQRIYEIQKTFAQPIPCQLVLTKCDQLSGFTEFFAESGNDEIIQAWGISLANPKNGEKTQDLFVQRFNALIKKLNQQLLWRLHQERNPMARPYIKDFPLQVERVKEFTFDFIKRLADTHLPLVLKGVYLTSALQIEAEPESNVIDDVINSTQRAVQIFKEPTPASRAYFVKQFFTHGLVLTQLDPTPNTPTNHWKLRITYAIAITIIGIAALIMGKDFERGVKQTYAVQNNLSDYQSAVQEIQDPDAHLIKTIHLLNTLKQQSTTKQQLESGFSSLVSYYSSKSQQKVNLAYHQALQTIFLPEFKNYLGEFIKNPVNRSADHVYSVLAAYLMLGDAAHFQADYIINTTREILPKSMEGNVSNQFITHITSALKATWDPLPLDVNLIEQTRKFLTNMPTVSLSYIILKNIKSNNHDTEIDLATNTGKNSVFISPQISNRMLVMFTAKAFAEIVSQEATTAAQEATMGNWILGTDVAATKSQEFTTPLIQQLLTTYVNNYIDRWETLLGNIRISHSQNLTQTDAKIVTLISNNSPLLQLLQTVHDNTYFDLIVASSPKLQSLGQLVEKNNQSDNLLYQIFSSLQFLHQYLQSVLAASNEQKAAFDLISNRVQHLGTPDAITQLLVVAEKSPEPVKTWLNKIANDAWHFLMQDAAHYIDTSWQDQVIRPYQTDIANRYPFSVNSDKEVTLAKFINFFGNPGVVPNFYNAHLQALVDTSTPDWRWKTIDNRRLPFSDETLRQIQQAMRIHQVFFPNDDNKLSVQFALQPYKFGKQIKSVKLRINDKQIVDEGTRSKIPHVIAWPRSSKPKMTSIQLTMANQQIVNRNFSGDWGWFKLVNQSFEGMVSRKELILNLSANEHPVKYLLFTEGQFNPFLTLNLRHFRFPQQLTETKS